VDLGLKDRVYVVTGGTRGLGLAAARELTADGARVVVSGLKVTPEAAAGVVEKLGGPEQAVVMQADNGDPRTPDRLINEARRAFDRFDGAFISVGGPPAGGVQSVTDEQWQSSFELCFLGAVRLSRAFAAQLEDGGVTGGLDKATAGIPLRRSGKPEEFGRAAAFLLSPAASYITGSMMTIDGGARASI
jgi:3-oxoacyl-[acyl-carrier protein] reductase